MKSLILAFVLALVVGIGGASAAAVVKARRVAPLVVADTTKRPHADSSALRVIDASGASAAEKPARDTVRPLVHADSGATHAAALSTAPTVSRADSLGAELHRTPQSGSAPGAAGASAPAAAANPAVKRASGPAAPVDVPPGERRVSRVFASMAPREAAKVLEQMSDADVAIILGNLQEKKVAAILAQLPAPRVASISRGVLRPAPGAK